MSTTPLKSLLLIGAVSPLGFGQYVVEALIPHLGKFTRVAIYNDLSRPSNPHKSSLLEKWSSLGIEIVPGDGFSPSTFPQGFDTLLLFLGNSGLHLQPLIIDLAISAGVRHVYPSEFGADLLVGRNWGMRYYKYKVSTRVHLETRAREVKDLGWTYFLVGRLAEWSILPHFGVDNKNAKARIYGTGKGRQSLISAKDAAGYLAASLGIEAEAGGRTFRISGSSPTYEEIFGIVEGVTGREYEVEYLDVGEAEREEEEARGRGDIEGELAASHKLVQGLEGTLLPQPWDNWRFPEIKVRELEEVMEEALGNKRFRMAYGLS